MMRRALVTGAFVCVAACGNDHRPPGACSEPPGEFPAGDPNGHAQPLGAAAGQARAGRVKAGDLPAVPSGLVTWREGDFVLANNKVALVIEDVGDSDLYDPWGGRPVGLARVSGGAMVEPNNFGEVFLLAARSSIVTDSVSVIADGSAGGPAIVRARGKLHPLPFFEAVISLLFQDQLTDIDAAIDYELAPDAEHVEVKFRFASPREDVTSITSSAHALMYTKRTPVWVPGGGFDGTLTGSSYAALVDDKATSWAYVPGDAAFGSSLAASGFVGAFGPAYDIPACGTSERAHAKIVIGGPGLDGIQAAVARALGEAQREVTGTVTRTGGAPAAGVRVHAVDPATGAYHTRATTAADGTYSLHVATGASIRLDAYRPGEALTSLDLGTGTTGDLTLPALGAVHVTATENGAAVPVRVQVFPTGGRAADVVPGNYGEPQLLDGRQLVRFAITGDTTIDLPAGTWRIVVSRGYEYELAEQTVTILAGQTATFDADMDRSVDTTGVQCADFHIHTWRSNDSGDDALDKLAQAVADGLELPVRSDHEFIADFSSEIAQLGIAPFANGMGSIELTSFEVWGHMGVFPLTADPATPNGGAPRWQTFPTAAAPEVKMTTLSPPAVFDAVRARPEAPVVIINHPRGGVNYFDYVGFDPATGMASLASDFDTKFTLVEVFNDSSWQSNRDGNVRDWFGLLNAGRNVFAVGSSDSHGLVTSPVGYPRTCLEVGTDDPRQLTPTLVRDRLAGGRSMVSGGVYVTARIGTAGPGQETTGAGSPLDVAVTVRAATWVDVDSIDVVVDGAIVDTIPIMPGDADPTDATIRYAKTIQVQPKATGGYVVIAAYGNQTLEPVHPGRTPFGVTNPIFVKP